MNSYSLLNLKLKKCKNVHKVARLTVSTNLRENNDEFLIIIISNQNRAPRVSRQG